MRKHALSLIALLLSASMSYGAGFQVAVQGLRQIAMGGTGTAVPWDASTIFYNPAGLSRLKGMQAYASVQFLLINTKYVQTPTGGYSQASQSKVYTPFNVYVGGPIKKDGKLGVGLGIYTPFGSGLSWDDDWEGRYSIQSISMQTIFFQPTVSYRINDVVSLGGGFIYATGNVKFKSAIPIQDQNGKDGFGELKGKGSGVGVNLGVHVKASDKIHVGLNYRSQVEMKVKDGEATFNVPSALKSSFPNTSFETKVQLPSVLSIGVGVKPIEDLTITAEANFIGWKSFDTLRFDFADNTPALQDRRAPRLYKNTMSLRLGAHYSVTDRLALMAGGAYDPTPVTDGFVSPDLPDADRWLITGGLTFKPTDKLTILAAIEYGASEKREAEYTPDNFNGMYQTKAVIPCIGVTYDF
jgi:long-chain fatty acid transport protein